MTKAHRTRWERSMQPLCMETSHSHTRGYVGHGDVKLNGKSGPAQLDRAGSCPPQASEQAANRVPGLRLFDRFRLPANRGVMRAPSRISAPGGLVQAQAAGAISIEGDKVRGPGWREALTVYYWSQV